MTDLGLFDAMYTARALRRLKRDPVPDELITQVLDAAIRLLAAQLTFRPSSSKKHLAYAKERGTQ